MQSKLDAARKSLLDLSLRNRLLSTRRGAGRSSRVEVVDEFSDEVFRRLVQEQKAMSFLPKNDADGSEASKDQSVNEHAQPDLEAAPAERHVDDRLQTTLTSEALQKGLLRLHYDARTHEEEQGVNILYLALGFLSWYEDDNSTIERFAPLILVPVELTRSSAVARFKLAWTQEDIVTNLSLQEKLRAGFGVELPDVPELEDLYPGQYFELITQAIAEKKRWRVLPNDIVLWFFSFSKFLMYRDLDASTWPEDRPLTEQRLVVSLLEDGFRCDPPLCGPNDNIDRILPPSATVHVVDADSSQAIAIEEVRRGCDLVIQGPPGTGKSQTIANLIAAAVKEGKRVLFVAEKMAALEVVKRRLDNVGLGDMCLELHSNKANKRAMLDELKRTLALGEPRLNGIQRQAQSLATCRDKLNGHSESLHTPLAESGVTAFQAIGQLVRLQRAGVTNPTFTLPQALDWNERDFESKRGFTNDLAEHLARLGNPAQHAWRGVEARGLLPTDASQFLNALPHIQQQLQQLCEASHSLASLLEVAPAATLMEVSQLALAAHRLTNAPAMDRTAIGNSVWSERHQEIQVLVEHGKDKAEAEKALSGVVTEDAWLIDLQQIAEIRRTLRTYGRCWWRFLVKKYWQASAELNGLLKGTPPATLDGRLSILDQLVIGRSAKLAIDADDRGLGIGLRAFGNRWQGINSDWNTLQAICDWNRECMQIAKMPSHFRDIAADADRAKSLTAPLASLSKLLKPLLQLLTNSLAPLQFDTMGAFGVANLQTAPLQELKDRLNGWIRDPEGLSLWVAYRIRLENLTEQGLEEFAAHLGSGHIAPAQAVDQLDFAYHEALLRHAYKKFPYLASFDGLSHEKLLESFRSLDLKRLSLARQEVAHAHFSRLPQHGGGVGEIGIILREINKKRRHLSIRKLLAEAGHAAQAIKPVFMMSPISVAQFLEPGLLEFDLLLIDEASQVEPVDALGAMARAKQTAVVGDDRQLPPTQFFTKMLSGDGDATDDGATSDIESILGLCRARGMRSELLRWHYRSRHQSLIAVSNYEFYDNKLYVIPSPARQEPQLGLRFRHISNGVFDRGKSATNSIEAAAVADAVLEHARHYPTKSLGVGAFSVAQRDAILDEIELRRRQQPELESFFNSSVAEPFFVKNLENIQGDERDVIYISVGYARDDSGYMAMNFGPLSNDGGERRLNVLITRAKERCEVFSSITSDDIDLNRGRSWGAKALKTFLRYAQLGELDVAVATGHDYDSEFEAQVAGALGSLGYEVHTQVGLAGFYIDLAVVDPENPACYLLGIECDGASYHSLRSARDRDRLRQQVLEDRGWTIHRIWSTDWFNRPEEQMRKLVSAIEQSAAKQAAQRGAQLTSTVAPANSITRLEIVRREEPAEENQPASFATPYVEASFPIKIKRNIHELTTHELAGITSQIVRIEGPIHQDEICRRTATLWGLKRAGSRIADAVERALVESVHQGTIEQDGLFFSAAGQAPPIRDRSSVTTTSLLKPEYLPPSEIRAALREVVRSHFGMTADEAVSEVARALGYQRSGPQIKRAIADEVNCLINEQQFTSRNGKLYVLQANSDQYSSPASVG